MANSFEADNLVVTTANGNVLIRHVTYGHPVQMMSCTKSFVALAIGLLYTEGRMRMGDRVRRWIPEIQHPAITIRHILTHRSGISSEWNGGREHDAAPNVYDYVLGLPMVAEPGLKEAYNNNAVELLGLIVEKETGQTLEEYLRKNLLAPIGAVREDCKMRWTRDAEGHPYAAYGLHLGWRALLKVGSLLYQNGSYDTKTYLDSQYMRMIWRDGLLFWRAANDDGRSINVLYMDGWLGNMLIVDRDAGLIGVRQVHAHRYFSDPQMKKHNKEADEMIKNLSKFVNR